MIKSSGLFDSEYYLKKYPDVAKSKVDPVEHYLECGGIEGRRPSPSFDGIGYLRSNPDVEAAGVNPIVHWLQYGRTENRPSPLHPETDAERGVHR